MLDNIKKLIAICLLTMVTACSMNESNMKDVTQEELITMTLSANKPVIVDVRTREEYSAGHIPQAINIPHDEVEARLSEFRQIKDQNIVLYCRSGARAAYSYEILEKHKIKNINHLIGDYIAWQEKKRPVAKEE